MITKIWYVFNIILYIGIGCLSFIKPEKVAATVGYVLSTAGAYAELKACYGGLMIAIGMIMMYLMLKDSLLGLLFIMVIYLGFCTGRFIGILSNQAYDQTTLTYFTFEVFSAVFSYLLYLRFR